MTSKRLRFHLGRYEHRVEKLRQEWIQSSVLTRLWSKDPTLWLNQDSDEISARLGWLDLPVRLHVQMDSLKRYIDELHSESIQNVILIGMGGSSLAPEVLHNVYGPRKGCPQLIVCDSTHPDRINEIAGRIDPSTSHFLVSSKSGTTLETISLFRYFWDLLKRSDLNPGHYFTAITDNETPLYTEAQKLGFRRIFRGRSDVGGRFSALSEFGIIPALLTGIEIDSAEKILKADSPYSEDSRAGLLLGAFLGEIAGGADKLTFIMSSRFASFPTWIEQLIAESLGKDGKGVIPIIGEPLLPIEEYGTDRSFVIYEDQSGGDGRSTSLSSSLREAGFPVVVVEINQPDQILSEMFRWEVAVACAGMALNINPFDQPDVQSAKNYTQDVMSCGFGLDHVLAEDREPAQAVDHLISQASAHDYVALQVFLAPNDRTDELLLSLRQKIRQRTGLATTVGYGPRFLHSTGQLHKGGPDEGVFIQIVDQPQRDIPVPGSDYTFTQMVAAQAYGDYSALKKSGRKVVRFDLGKDSQAALKALTLSLSP
ncbi:hypothetical protein ACFLT9_11660 [Acidobacteriota bacterium]